MLKRCLLAILFICTACAPAANASQKQVPAPTPPGVTGTREYVVRQELRLDNEGEAAPAKQNLWVALIRDLAPYQQVLSQMIAPNGYTLSTDEYGNQYAEFDLSAHPPGTAITVTIETRVRVYELVYDLSTCEGGLPVEFTQAELHVESANPQVMALARELSKGAGNPCEQVRAFYDYAGDALVYTYNRQDWGAQATFGLMGADCSEYASLVMALSRAEGIPARYYEGLLYLSEAEREAELGATEHAWLDVYLPGAGWVALDPTLGRTPFYRERYFAHHTPNHIIVTTGRNPSILRGASYWTHLYWPGDSTVIRVSGDWMIVPVEP